MESARPIFQVQPLVPTPRGDAGKRKALKRVAGRDRLYVCLILFHDLSAQNEGGDSRINIVKLLAAVRLLAVDDRLYDWSMPFTELFG